MVEITLTEAEFRFAASVGMERRIQNALKGRQNKRGTTDQMAWRADVEGACGECAVAKFLGVYWAGALDNFQAKDVGELQVRTTSGQDLAIYPTDTENDIFIAVQGMAPNFRIWGFEQANHCKKQQYYQVRYNGRVMAWWVPHDHLRPIEGLSAYIESIRKQRYEIDENDQIRTGTY